MTTRHGDLAFCDAERLSDERFKGAVGFVVFRRGADTGFEVGAGLVARATIDAVGAARRCETDAKPAQRTEPWP